ncbi:hypothetical protein AB4Z13_31905 [Rhizobium sp. YAF28]|uniref:hypothetical protein n=1 Tax=Rhizobium sp. YAF28 TaxID=3233081 RepID=UPI003F97B3D4
MKFRLFYEGELLSSGNNSKRPAHKHAIRRAFHKQLRELWRVDGNLINWMDYSTSRQIPQFEKIARDYPRWNYNWVRLVSDATRTHCSLEVLMLRPVTMTTIGNLHLSG